VSQKADELPSVVYSPAISQKELKDLDDGIWYFHAQFINSDGWGEISHFKFKIDTESPEYFYIKPVVDDGSNIVSKLLFDAHDKLSGIDYYEISIDNKESIIWKDDGTHIFVIPELNYGKHLVTARVFDLAGNYITSSFEFEYLETLLDAPKIIEHRKELTAGSVISIKGVTYSNSDVAILIKKDDKDIGRFVVKSDNNGIFFYILDAETEKGVYSIYAQVKSKDGSMSEYSDKINIEVKQPRIIRDLYNIIFVMLIVIILLIVIVISILIKMSKFHKFLLSQEIVKNKMITKKGVIARKVTSKKVITKKTLGR
jgi:hypothetical protein